MKWIILVIFVILHLDLAISTSGQDDKKSEFRPSSCKEVLRERKRSGVATIYLKDHGFDSMPADCSITVYCEMMETRWSVLMRRVSDEEVFHNRTWEDYKQGFGDPSANFWIGLETMHQLTKDKTPRLRVNLEDFEGNNKFAEYSTFKIDSEDYGYAITVGDYRGDAGDSLRQHNGAKFSTIDRDNDGDGRNCAESYKGAWWYMRGCAYSQLTGIFYQTSGNFGILWYNGGSSVSYKRAEMKILM